MSAATLTLSGLSVGHRNRSLRTTFVLGGIDAEVDPGRLVCLLGPNGSGKSTLLQTIAGFLPPLAGEIFFADRPAARYTENERARFVSVVLTERADSGMLNVLDLVGLGRYPYTPWTGRLTVSDRKVVDWALEVVGARELSGRTVMSLSDGERQKIMIARALAQEPRLIVLDEPTAFLDLPRKVEVMKLLGRLARDTACSVLLSTHELEIAQNLADQLWLIQPTSSKSTGGQDSVTAPATGSLSIGSPEDLALSGEFERLFTSNGVQFDQTTGRFLFGENPERRAVVRGTGIPRRWTERALNRIGIESVEPDGEEEIGRTLPLVTVQTVSGGYLWTLTRGGATEGFDSIAALISALEP